MEGANLVLEGDNEFEGPAENGTQQVEQENFQQEGDGNEEEYVDIHNSTQDQVDQAQQQLQETGVEQEAVEVLMARYCPLCSALINKLRALPNGQNKTEFSILHEYAARLDMDVQHEEQADVDTGMFKCCVRLCKKENMNMLYAQGNGIGRSKKEAKQMAAAYIIGRLQKVQKKGFMFSQMQDQIKMGNPCNQIKNGQEWVRQECNPNTSAPVAQSRMLDSVAARQMAPALSAPMPQYSQQYQQYGEQYQTAQYGQGKEMPVVSMTGAQKEYSESGQKRSYSDMIQGEQACNVVHGYSQQGYAQPAMSQGGVGIDDQQQHDQQHRQRSPGNHQNDEVKSPIANLQLQE